MSAPLGAATTNQFVLPASGRRGIQPANWPGFSIGDSRLLSACPRHGVFISLVNRARSARRHPLAPCLRRTRSRCGEVGKRAQEACIYIRPAAMEATYPPWRRMRDTAVCRSEPDGDTTLLRGAGAGRAPLHSAPARAPDAPRLPCRSSQLITAPLRVQQPPICIGSAEKGRICDARG